MSDTDHTPEEALRILEEFFPEGFYINTESNEVKPILGARDAVSVLHDAYPEGVVIDVDSKTFSLDEIDRSVRITNIVTFIVGCLLGAALVLIMKS